MKHLFLAVFLSVMPYHSGKTMLIAQAQTVGVDDPIPATMEALRDRYRPLLVFAATDNDRRFLRQAHLFAAGSYLLHERQVLFVPVVLVNEAKSWGVVLNSDQIATLVPEDAVDVRRRFHISPGAFTVILVGKDGGEKFRTHNPVTIDRLNALIDAMPMRQQEVQDGHAR
jgi:hypothetical protein